MATDLVVVLSSDWVGSTQARADLGEDTADAVQEVHDTLLRRVIATEGGTVVKHYGDGVMATFNSATAALAAAVKIQGDFAAYRESPDALTRIDVRVGLAAGDVKRQAGDIFGLPVVEAVRLQSAAAPNEVFCSDLVRILSQGRGGFAFEDVGVLELKGLPAPVHAHRVRRPEAVGRSSATPVATAQPRAPARPRARWLYAIAGLATLAAATAGVWSLRPSASVPDATVVPPEPASSPRARSIAVLPCTNMSPNEADKHFATGIHEEMLNRLARVGDLLVIARTSVERYVGTPKTLAEIAAELGVANVMECSVRYDQGQVLVTAQLIDPESNAHLWSNSYRGPLADVFGIQEDIATKIAAELRVQLTPKERGELGRIPTESEEAYTLFLAANRASMTDVRRLELHSRAVAIDPRFAEAWTGVAQAQLWLRAFGRPEDADARLLEAERAATRAVDLLPQAGWTHAFLAGVFTAGGEWGQAEREFAIASALGGDASAPELHALMVGRFAAARDMLQKHLSRDPLNDGVRTHLLQAHVVLGDIEAAERVYAEGERLLGDWAGDLVELHWRLGAGDLQRVRASRWGWETATLRDLVDAPAAGLAEVRRFAAQDAWNNNVGKTQLALWAAYFGDEDLALDLLSAAFKPVPVNVNYVWMPVFRDVRATPRFRQLLRDLGLVSYWQEFSWPGICWATAGDEFVCS